MSFRLAQAAGFAPLLLVHGRVFPKVHWYDYLFDFGFFYDKSVDTEVWEYDEDEEWELVEDGAVTLVSVNLGQWEDDSVEGHGAPMYDLVDSSDDEEGHCVSEVAFVHTG